MVLINAVLMMLVLQASAVQIVQIVAMANVVNRVFHAVLLDAVTPTRPKKFLIIAGSVISGLILFTALGLLLWCLFCTRVGKAKVIDNARPRDLQQDKDNEYTLMDEKTEGYNY